MKNERLAVLTKIDELENAHCASCTKKNSQNYKYVCYKNCDIGKKLLDLGKELESIKRERKPKMTKEVLDYDHYKVLKAQGKTTREIAQEYGIKENTLYVKAHNWKKEHGEKNDDYQEVKQEVKEAVAVDTNVIKVLELKISEMEQQVKDYPNIVNKAKQLENEKTSLEIDFEKAITYHQELFNKLDQADGEIKELKAAAEDLEHETDQTAKREEQLLVELDEWKEKAQLYASENEKLSKGYKVIGKVVDENKMLRAVLKEVL